MWHWRVLLLPIILDMQLWCNFICTAELRRQAALASNVSFVTKFFTIHHNIGPDSSGNTCGTSTYREVKPINRVGSYLIDNNIHWYNRCGHIKVRTLSSNYNSNFAKEIHIWQLNLTYIDTIDRRNAPNWQQRTTKLSNFTQIPGIATSCRDVFWLIFHWIPYQTLRYDSHEMHYVVTWCFHPIAPLATFALGNTPWLWLQFRRHCRQEIKLA